MISTHQAQEILRTTRNPHIQSLCETIIDLWRMFGEANCDAVETRDELDALMARISRTTQITVSVPAVPFSADGCSPSNA